MQEKDSNTNQPIGKRGRNGLLPLSKYSHARVYAGAKMLGSKFIEETFSEDFNGKTQNQYAQYLRERFGNADIHVRLYGGPRKVDWFIPPKMRAYEGLGETALLINHKESLETRLQIQLDRIRQLEKQLEASIVTPGPIVDYEEEIEEEEPAPDPITAFFNDLVTGLGPMLMEKLKVTIGTKSIQQTITASTHQMPNSFADNQPTNNQETEEYDIPDPVCEVFDRIDWQRTDYMALLDKLTKASGLLGIVWK